MKGPNPTAVVLGVLALLVIVIAFKGTQDNWVAAILGHAPSWATGGGSSSKSSGSGSPSTTTSPGVTSLTTGLTPGQESQPGGVPGLGGGISGVTASGNPLPVAPPGQNQYPE